MEAYISLNVLFLFGWWFEFAPERNVCKNWHFFGFRLMVIAPKSVRRKWLEFRRRIRLRLNFGIKCGTYVLSSRDFQGGEKPKGGPLKIEKFFVEGDWRKGLEGVRSLLKPSSTFLINKNIKFQICGTIIRKYLKCIIFCTYAHVGIYRTLLTLLVIIAVITVISVGFITKVL